MDLNTILDKARAFERFNEAEWRREHKLYLKFKDSRRVELAKRMEGKCLHCNRMTYKRWLKGYLLSGGVPTHVYDYEWSKAASDWWYARFDVEISPVYGANSINLIVQEGITVSGDPGHSTIYWMDGFRCSNAFVPIYSDIRF